MRVKYLKVDERDMHFRFIYTLHRCCLHATTSSASAVNASNQKPRLFVEHAFHLPCTSPGFGPHPVTMTSAANAALRLRFGRIGGSRGSATQRECFMGHGLTLPGRILPGPYDGRLHATEGGAK